MSKKDKKEKTIDEYRRDIFILKTKIKEEGEYLQQIKQKHSEVDVFADQSYTFQMKLKILQNNLADVKHKMDKYALEDNGEHKEYYQLNFCVYAFVRACEVIGLGREMVFRAVDIENKKAVNYLDFANFLREVLRLNSYFINPIMRVLDPTDSTQVTLKRYTKFLQVFMLEQQKTLALNNLQLIAGVQNIAKELITQQILPKNIWKVKLLNIATTISGLTKHMKNLDILDCVGVYCRCDPNKEGVVKTQQMVVMLEQKINDVKNFMQGVPGGKNTFKLKKK